MSISLHPHFSDGAVWQGSDLYCGAGGSSSGLLEAFNLFDRDVDFVAVNHWQPAISTHLANHPNVRHFCTGLDKIDVRRMFKIAADRAVLWASPECIWHSRARNSTPINDQRRSSAGYVLRWARILKPDVVFIENVEEFVKWGPLYPLTGLYRGKPVPDGLQGRPVKPREGEIFRRWVRGFQRMGYVASWRVLTCADYGDPTTRKRLFMQFVRPPMKPCWPEFTHGKSKFVDEDGYRVRRWVGSEEVIDWTDKGYSVFNRKKQLSPKTMRRLIVGLERFWTDPYGIKLRGTSTTFDLSKPVPTLTAGGTHLGVARPFIINLKGQSTAMSAKLPVPTLTAHARHVGVASPAAFLLGQQSGSAPRSTKKPAMTIATSGAVGLAQGLRPFILPKTRFKNETVRAVELPLQTVDTTSWGIGLAQPAAKIVPRGSKVARAGSIVCGTATYDLVAVDGHRYLPVLSGDQIFLVDIYYRMLRVPELAKAQGFPDGYVFDARTQEEKVALIGNAVPRNTARSIALAFLSQNPKAARLVANRMH